MSTKFPDVSLLINRSLAVADKPSGQFRLGRNVDAVITSQIATCRLDEFFTLKLEAVKHFVEKIRIESED
jgi:hypothetical protein